MMPEIWVAVAAALLGVAAIAGGAAILAGRRPWGAVAIGTRVAALAALIVALIATVMASGQWTASDHQQAVLSLVVAMGAIHLLLVWPLGAAGVGPMVDIVAIILSLMGVFLIQAGAPSSTCTQQASLFQVDWILFLLGGGSLLVAACAGLTLALRWLLVWRGLELDLPVPVSLYDLLRHAAALALVALASGLLTGVWWAWRTTGVMLGANAGEVWMAVAWLITAMSLLAWQLDGRRSQWAAGLALVAAAAVLVGLLFPGGATYGGI